MSLEASAADPLVVNQGAEMLTEFFRRARDTHDFSVNDFLNSLSGDYGSNTGTSAIDRALPSVPPEPSCFPSSLGEAFALNVYLESALTRLSELHWLLTHDEATEEANFQSYFELALKCELRPLHFLENEFRFSIAKTGIKGLLEFSLRAKAITSNIRAHAEQFDPFKLNLFAASAMREMSKLTSFEVEMQLRANAKEESYRIRQRIRQSHKSPLAGKTESWQDARPHPSEIALQNSLYRAFDAMDDIMGIDYEHDIGMRTDLKITERLYEGAGIGVQTSYSTLFIVLDELAPCKGASFIDLGSGYGRAGMVVGLLRPDMKFIGYEYVEHRVDSSNRCAENLGLGEKVQFLKQDLSLADFSIPAADIYYLYDPFSEMTYQYVFSQLKEIGKNRTISVVTKGRATDWFQKAISHETWTKRAMLDEGTLGIFVSVGMGDYV